MTKILGMDSANAKAKKMPYCSNMTISAALVIEMANRIAELEKELSHAQTMGDREQSIRDLEQRAKGINEAAEYSKIPYGRNGFGFQMYMCSRNSLLNCRDKLLIKAIALKEQGK